MGIRHTSGNTSLRGLTHRSALVLLPQHNPKETPLMSIETNGGCVVPTPGAN